MLINQLIHEPITNLKKKAAIWTLGLDPASIFSPTENEAKISEVKMTGFNTICNQTHYFLADTPSCEPIGKKDILLLTD